MAMATKSKNDDDESSFPCALSVDLHAHPDLRMTDSESESTRTIALPFPTRRLATSAMGALQVDRELSPHVRRSLSVVPPSAPTDASRDDAAADLRIWFGASTNRLLRVAVNGFMESVGLVLSVMEELDIDVLGR